MTMFERVAHAARDAYYNARNSEAFVDQWEAIAVAAIKAMRDPSDAMMLAAYEADDSGNTAHCDNKRELARHYQEAPWRAAIDAALKETGNV